MKTITKFQAYTGREFTDAAACEKYEERCLKANAVIERLNPEPKDDGCQFANGHGFIKHDPAEFMAVRAELLRLAQQEYPHKWFEQSLADPTVDASWAGRMIDEACNERLVRAWARIQCTDKQCREWGQPYYASHPDKGEQRQLNA